MTEMTERFEESSKEDMSRIIEPIAETSSYTEDARILNGLMSELDGTLENYKERGDEKCGRFVATTFYNLKRLLEIAYDVGFEDGRHN